MVTDTTAPPLTVWLGSAMYTFPSDREATIGRSRQCDICLDDPEVAGWISRVHAELRVEGAQWVAVDRSRNGIFVDGKKVDTAPIRDGTQITVGNPAGPKLAFRIAPPA
ncbi:FHA domain-containing protein, partial [Mycobacterium branderi]